MTRPCGCTSDPVVFGHLRCRLAGPRPRPILGCPPECRRQHAVPKAELKPLASDED